VKYQLTRDECTSKREFIKIKIEYYSLMRLLIKKRLHCSENGEPSTNTKRRLLIPKASKI